ncbi:hypothetical protein CPL00368_CDS0161 [Klebsiella phage DevonBitter]
MCYYLSRRAARRNGKHESVSLVVRYQEAVT